MSEEHKSTDFVSSDKPKLKSTSLGAKILIGSTGGVAVALSVVCASFIAPAFRRFCLPFVPATSEQIQHILNFLPKNSKAKLLDIGSGDGRVVIAAANHGLQAEGVELNPWLVWYSRLMAIRQGMSRNTKFIRKDLWKLSVKPYDYVVIFGVEEMMKQLEYKLLAESPNAKVIACRFPLPNLAPVKTIEDGINTVWFYDLSTNV